MKNCFYIKESKWDEFKKLHKKRFRYDFDGVKNRYFRKMRTMIIFIDAETRHIYLEDYLDRKREAPPAYLLKLFNREMVEVIKTEEKKNGNTN